MTKSILIVMSLILARAAFAEPAQLPDDVPRVRYSPNPLYSEEGFVFGQNPRVTATYYGGVSQIYDGEFFLGMGVQKGKKLDAVCEDYYNQKLDYWKGDAKEQAVLRQQKDDDCAIFTQPFIFSMLEPELYSRYVSLTKGHQTSATVVGYYFSSVSSIFSYFETHFSWRAFASGSHNFLQKLWYTNAEQFHSPPVYTEMGGENTEESITDNVRNSITEYRSGQTTGYILKASMNHAIRKTYEIMMQDTSMGGSLQKMNLKYEPELFDHIVLAMLSGHLVTVHWVELRGYWGGLWQFLLNYKTNYRITGIEVLPK